MTVLSSPCKGRESLGAPRGGGQFDFAPVVCVVVVVEIITLYQVQAGRFLATTGYVAPFPPLCVCIVVETIIYTLVQ